eukprot:75719-Pyramimonas_sp.AAC.1
MGGVRTQRAYVSDPSRVRRRHDERVAGLPSGRRPRHQENKHDSVHPLERWAGAGARREAAKAVRARG